MGDQRRDGRSEAFAAYVEQVLVPELEPGTVVILDNLATHKNACAAKAMRDAGCWFLFLPPYSPDLNPIEMAFSKLKAHLRRIGARTFTDMFQALSEICELYSQTNAGTTSRLPDMSQVKGRTTPPSALSSSMSYSFVSSSTWPRKSRPSMPRRATHMPVALATIACSKEIFVPSAKLVTM
jgi:transposase